MVEAVDSLLANSPEHQPFSASVVKQQKETAAKTGNPGDAGVVGSQHVGIRNLMDLAHFLVTVGLVTFGARSLGTGSALLAWWGTCGGQGFPRITWPRPVRWSRIAAAAASGSWSRMALRMRVCSATCSSRWARVRMTC
jgi:hypothetical protein